MCSRITLTQSQLPEVAELLEAELDAADAAAWRPRYNVAPTDRHVILRESDGRRQLTPAFWGFVVHGRPLIINARSETAAHRPAFRGALERRRCVVPTDGFYEWEGEKGDRRPLWFHPPDRGLLLLAGLYDLSHEGHLTFTILTTAANEVVARAHDRMPVILTRDETRVWLSHPATDLLVPAPPDLLVAQPVGPRVNRVENDDPECLAPPPPPPLPKQLRLF
jgi:putative SOS response-associated peptidase YedK